MLSYLINTLTGEVPEDFSWKSAPGWFCQQGVKLVLTTPVAYATHIYGNSYARVIAQSLHGTLYGPAPSIVTHLAANAAYYRSETDMIEFAQEMLPPMMVGGVIIGGFLFLTFGQNVINKGLEYFWGNEEKSKILLLSKGNDAVEQANNTDVSHRHCEQKPRY